MPKQAGWLLGLVGLILAGFLVACGTTYNSSSDGLVVVGSVGSSLLESFTFSLTNGHIAPISNSPNDTSNQTCVLPGTPYALVLDPAGQYAYAILSGNQACGNAGSNGIASFKVNSDGTLGKPGTPVSDPNPVALAMDQSGKYLFVAEGTGVIQPPATTPTPCIAGSTQYQVCAYAIGSGGSLTPIPATFNFVLPGGYNTPNFAALAATPTTLPALVNGVQTAVCSNPGNTAPTNEFLYVADSANNAVYEFGVDMSSGTLTNPPSQSQVPTFSTGATQTGATPSGVVVDPCDRFVYVSNLQSNQISGYTLCSVVSGTSCPAADGRLNPIAGSPFSQSVGLGPGPLVVDPFGNYLYVLETRSNQVLPFSIASQSGVLTAKTAAATGQLPISMAIRGDNNWLFVTNFTSATLSQFSIAPATGALSALPPVQTDNEPWGVAVK
ncbi:MAG TPA: beta-propeller fold lactonase family protein [Candidatus Sulfotelmatobacter sp.]|nr:beta-propeller fold lactonase family protein [Candidatus Sulfotelmatobacter sp.]